MNERGLMCCGELYDVVYHELTGHCVYQCGVLGYVTIGGMWRVQACEGTEFTSESSWETASWPGDGLWHLHGPQEQHWGGNPGLWQFTNTPPPQVTYVWEVYVG